MSFSTFGTSSFTSATSGASSAGASFSCGCLPSFGAT
uniref:Uncharacterized protein n=1 Tax=Arundo donax TaxID=35708 RepID=A0A0A9Q8J8_ARUDO